MRPYDLEDLDKVVSLYKEAFAEPPWCESWTTEEVVKDVEYALSQPQPIMLVGEECGNVVGFTWGYKIPMDNFPFLERLVQENASYMDEIAVGKNARKRSVGTDLGKAYIQIARSLSCREVVLRTDQRNSASMALFRRLGFSPVTDLAQKLVYDPEYKERIYLRMYL